MTRNQTKTNRTETRTRGPRPCSALFSELFGCCRRRRWCNDTAVKRRGFRQCQTHHHWTAWLYQQSHCHIAAWETTEKLTISKFTLAAQILNKQHGLATLVRQDTEWSLEVQSEDDSQLEWLAVKVQGVTIINVYKPPPTRLTRASLPEVNHHCIYPGDFKCHHTEWG